MSATALITRSEPLAKKDYIISMAYLRALTIVVVVLVHSVLAYCSFAPTRIFFGANSKLWESYPIVDVRRWAGFDPIVGFTDPLGMSLMFFLSGLFVWNSLQRKNVARFGRERVIRLGLPFVVGICFRGTRRLLPGISRPTVARVI